MQKGFSHWNADESSSLAQEPPTQDSLLPCPPPTAQVSPALCPSLPEFPAHLGRVHKHLPSISLPGSFGNQWVASLWRGINIYSGSSGRVGACLSLPFLPLIGQITEKVPYHDTLCMPQPWRILAEITAVYPPTSFFVVKKKSKTINWWLFDRIWCFYFSFSLKASSPWIPAHPVSFCAPFQKQTLRLEGFMLPRWRTAASDG